MYYVLNITYRSAAIKIKFSWRSERELEKIKVCSEWKTNQNPTARKINENEFLKVAEAINKSEKENFDSKGDEERERKREKCALSDVE